MVLPKWPKAKLKKGREVKVPKTVPEKLCYICRRKADPDEDECYGCGALVHAGCGKWPHPSGAHEPADHIIGRPVPIYRGVKDTNE
jgi:hypothetical protein